MSNRKLVTRGILLTSALLAAGYATKLYGFSNKIKTTLTGFRIHGFKDFALIIAVKYKVFNYTAFDISVDDLYATLQVEDPTTKQYVDIVTSDNVIPTLVLNRKKETVTQEIFLRFQLNFTNIIALWDVLSGKIQKVKLITSLNYNGFEKDFESPIDVPSLKSALQIFLPKRGLSGISNRQLPAFI